jgi:hypothetical protein
VEGRCGGRLLIEKLDKLRTALQNYFGMLNEIKNKLKPETVYEKPDVLEIIEICRDMGIPRVDADYEHQPYIWTLEFRTAIQEEALWKNLNAMAAQSGASTNASV